MTNDILWYADLGLQVFPCKSGAKTPLTEHGFKDASECPEQIQEWWDRWPSANVAVATGEVSGIVVLDIDKKHGGFQSLAALEKEHGTLPESWTARTGGGGIHVYFKHPGTRVPNSAGKVGEGLDIRGDGGYVLLPPSGHESGNNYEWKHPPETLADAPAWLLELITKKEPAPKPGKKKLVSHGKQHDFLVKEAGKLFRIGYEAEQLSEFLWHIHQTQCEPNPEATRETINKIAHSTATWSAENKYNQTDMGNAERFGDMFEDRARYCTHWKKWLIWDGIRWNRDSTLVIQELAKKSVDQIKREAIEIKGDLDRQKAQFQWYTKSQSSERLGALVKQARSILNVAPDELDTDKWLLNVKNGTIDLKTGVLGKHDRKHLITKLAPFSFGQKKCPLFLAFIAQIFRGRTDLIEFVQKFLGYSLTGDTRERIFVIFHGKGRNGKSTLLELVQDMLGDYSISTRPETLLVKEKGAPSNDIAKLRGARFVSAKENEEGKRLASSVMKELTGNDTVTARFLYGEEFDFRPHFKLCLGTNHLPRVSAEDQACWDRIRLVPFDVRVGDGGIAEDKSLPDKLREEIDGILSWCVEGCLAWQREGLGAPECVSAATEEYREEEDLIAAFLDACCVLGKDEEEESGELYKAYKCWCIENGHRPLGSQNLKKRLETKGYVRVRKKEGWLWLSLSLTPEAIIVDKGNY
jgi:putative DNA primase/helicase